MLTLNTFMGYVCLTDFLKIWPTHFGGILNNKQNGAGKFDILKICML